MESVPEEVGKGGLALLLLVVPVFSSNLGCFVGRGLAACDSEYINKNKSESEKKDSNKKPAEQIYQLLRRVNEEKRYKRIPFSLVWPS